MTWPAVAVVVAALAGQSLWIKHALDGVGQRVTELKADTGKGFDGVNARLDRIDTTLAAHGERLAKLEPQRERP